MNAIGMLFLAAAAAGQYPPGEFFPGNAHVGGKKFLRHHVVQSGPPPAGGPIAGDPNCPPGMGGPGGAGAAGAGGRRFPSTRSQAFFVEPLGMKVGWQTAAGGATGQRDSRAGLPAGAAHGPGPLQLHAGLHLPAQADRHPEPRGAVALPDDRGRPGDPGHRRLPDPQPDPDPVHGGRFRQRPGRQLRHQGDLSPRSQVPGAGQQRRDARLDEAGAGRRPDPGGRPPRGRS